MKRIHPYILDAAAILIGCFVMAAGMVIFTIPNNLAPGGVSGLATAVGFIANWPVGVLTFAFNIPILLMGLKSFGWRRLVGTLAASFIFAAFIDLLRPFTFVYTNNVLLASVMGGVMLGIGGGLVFARGYTTGGTDLVTMLLRKPFPLLPAGTLLMAIDALVVLVAVIVFKDIEVALYSGVTIFVQGKVIDAIMQGMDHAKVMLIITDQPDILIPVLMEESDRGITEFAAKGGYSRKNKSVLMSVARRSEVGRILKAITRLDEDAFIVMHNATEVRGNGFKELEV